MIRPILYFVAVALSLGACSTAPHARLADDAVPAPALADRLAGYRTTLRRAATHPRHALVSAHVAQAEGWLERLTDLPDDAPLRPLLEQAVQGELELIYTTLERADATAAAGLEAAR